MFRHSLVGWASASLSTFSEGAVAEREIDPASISVVTNGIDFSRFRQQPKDAGLVYYEQAAVNSCVEV